MTRATSQGHTSRRSLVAALTLAVALVGSIGAAYAGTESPPPGVVPPTDTDFIRTIEVDQFDPATGTLTAVTIELNAGVNGDMFVENLSTQSAGSGVVSLAAAVSINLQADPAGRVSPALPEAIQTFTLDICDTPDPTSVTGCDETPDFAGPAGLTVTGLNGTDTQSATLTDAATLALFTGTGTVAFDVEAAGDSSGTQDTGNVFFAFFTQASAEVIVTYQFVNPAIDIEKATNGDDADEPTGPQIEVGGDVTWTYVVTNTGDVDLTDVVVTDDQGVAVTCPQDTLAVAESMTCTGTGTAELGQYANIGTVTGVGPNGTEVTDEDPSHYIGIPIGQGTPAIDIEKATNGVDADTPTGPEINVGDPVVWSYVVTNTGGVDLGNVVVTDDQGVAVTCPTDVLPAGESMTCTASGTAEVGQYANIGSVSGEDSVGTEVTDTDPSHYIGVPTGGDDSSVDELPATGSSSSRQAIFGAVTLGLGVALLAVSRRRSDA